MTTRAALLMRYLFLILFVSLLASTAFAVVEGRAGSGRSRGGSILLLPLIFGYAAISSVLIYRKSRRVNELLGQLEHQYNLWQPDHLKAHIEETYFAVQYAWRDRDPEAARVYMSQRLYEKHKLQINDMLAQRRKNEMENITLLDTKIVEVLDYRDNSKDTFWAVIRGEMIDTLVDEQSGNIIEGDRRRRTRSFRERWRFKREAHGWVLDEIDPTVSIPELAAFRTFSEEQPTIQS